MNYEKLPKTISAEELLFTPMPPVKWIIPDCSRPVLRCLPARAKRAKAG